MSQYARLLVLLLITLTACVEDPPVPVTGEAILRGRFIPLDSVSKLELRDALIDGLIGQTSDDLNELDSLEDAGVPGDYEGKRLLLNNRLDSLQEIGSTLSSTISRLTRGDIRLDFLTAEGTEEQIRYDNSQSFYGLPLYGEATQATFRIGYGSYLQKATISYQIENLFENRVVRQRGFDLALGLFDFDSVRVTCPQDTCNTDEILYTFYF